MRTLLGILTGAMLTLSVGCDEELLSSLAAGGSASAKAALFSAPIRQRDQDRAKDGSCQSPIRDRDRDRDRTHDRNPIRLQLRDGSCLEG